VFSFPFFIFPFLVGGYFFFDATTFCLGDLFLSVEGMDFSIFPDLANFPLPYLTIGSPNACFSFLIFSQLLLLY